MQLIRLKDFGNKLVGFIITEPAPNFCLSINQIKIITEHNNRDIFTVLIIDMIDRFKKESAIYNSDFADLTIYVFCDETEIEQQQKIWFINNGFKETNVKRKNSNKNYSTMLTYVLDLSEENKSQLLK